MDRSCTKSGNSRRIGPPFAAESGFVTRSVKKCRCIAAGYCRPAYVVLIRQLIFIDGEEWQVIPLIYIAHIDRS